MKIHHLQHVAFEGLGSIEATLKEKGYSLSATRLYKNQPLPSCDDFDWLIVMGGPMSINDEQTYPWLTAEKHFIAQAIDAGKTILGICLGAQLISNALGSKIYKNPFREIGWFDITRLPETQSTIMAGALPPKMEAFHWHGDTFDIPQGATPIASSEACKNQGFVIEDRIVALQFHLETNFESAQTLIRKCHHELDGSQYVQTKTEMLSETQRFTQSNQVMDKVLAALENPQI